MGGGAARLFLLFFIPCSADHERDWPPCKVAFFGLATNTLNVRNNNNNDSCIRLNIPVASRQIGTGNVEVSSTGGSPTALDSGDEFLVTFTGVYGNLPLMTVRPTAYATVSSVIQGDAPFRKETQAFSCSPGSIGDLVINWRGLGNVTIGANDDLANFANAISSGLTSVTVNGIEKTTVCSGQLVYVTFQEVFFENLKIKGDGQL